MNHYPHHIGDYARDTAHLSITQHGAYRLMMDLYYGAEKPLPKDRARLYVLLRCQSKLDRTAADTVLVEFFQEREDGWHHKRCDIELAKYHGKAVKASKSATARWQSERNANASANASENVVRTQCDGNANQEPRTKNQEPSAAIPSVDNSTRVAAEAAKLLAARGVKFKSENSALIGEWMAHGATTEMLLQAVEKARENKPEPEPIPAAYLAKVVADMLQPKRVNGSAWWASEAATNAKAAELGLHPRGGESWESFRGRIRAAIDERARA